MQKKEKLKKIKILEQKKEVQKKESERKFNRLNNRIQKNIDIDTDTLENIEETEKTKENENDIKEYQSNSVFKRNTGKKSKIKQILESIKEDPGTSIKKIGGTLAGPICVLIILFGIFTTMLHTSLLQSATLLIMPYSDKEDFKLYQEEYDKCNAQFMKKVEEFLQKQTTNVNLRGDTLEFGVNGLNNEDLINDNYVNGLKLKYIKDADHQDVDSNIEDIIAMMAVMMGQRQSENKEVALKIIDYLYDISHIFRFKEGELYSCKNGCSIVEYNCNDKFNNYENSELRYQPFLVEKGKNASKSEIEIEDRIIDKKEKEYSPDTINYKILEPRYTCNVCGEVYNMPEEKLNELIKKYLENKNSNENYLYDCYIWEEVCDLYKEDEGKSIKEKIERNISKKTITGCQEKDSDIICYHGVKYTDKEGNEEAHYLGRDKENCHCGSPKAHWACKYTGENEVAHREVCEANPIGCGGYYYCGGHEHPYCTGHQLACCMGHRDMEATIKIRFFEDMKNDINIYPFNGEEKEAATITTRGKKESKIINAGVKDIDILKGGKKEEPVEKLKDTKELIKYEDTEEYWNTLSDEEKEKLLEKEEKDAEKAEKEEEKQARKEEKEAKKNKDD